MTWDLLLTGARLAPLVHGIETIADAAIAITGGVIAWCGPHRDLPHDTAMRTVDVVGRLVTPGLIDCHTHLVFGGDRVDEFEQRLRGEDYAEIHRAGGGIGATVRATRAASDADLVGTAAERANQLTGGGVTTIEVKSGYGLDVDTELRMLRAARELGRRARFDVHATFLGAHSVPPEYRDDPDAYIDVVCDEMLPAVAHDRLADSVDTFCEDIAFSVEQCERVLTRAASLGIPCRVHADQLTASGGAQLAARVGALSADHLEHSPPEALAAMAGAGVVAVLLPGASLIGDEARPDVETMRQLGLAMAVATDANPGTSPLLSLPLAMALACRRFGLTVAEAWMGATRHAARALGIGTEVGALVPGMRADLAVWDAESPAEVVYWMGTDLCSMTVHRGRTAHWG